MAMVKRRGDRKGSEEKIGRAGKMRHQARQNSSTMMVCGAHSGG